MHKECIFMNIFTPHFHRQSRKGHRFSLLFLSLGFFSSFSFWCSYLLRFRNGENKAYTIHTILSCAENRCFSPSFFIYLCFFVFFFFSSCLLSRGKGVCLAHNEINSNCDQNRIIKRKQESVWFLGLWLLFYGLTNQRLLLLLKWANKRFQRPLDWEGAPEMELTPSILYDTCLNCFVHFFTRSLSLFLCFIQTSLQMQLQQSQINVYVNVNTPNEKHHFSKNESSRAFFFLLLFVAMLSDAKRC